MKPVHILAIALTAGWMLLAGAVAQTLPGYTHGVRSDLPLGSGAWRWFGFRVEELERGSLEFRYRADGVITTTREGIGLRFLCVKGKMNVTVGAAPDQWRPLYDETERLAYPTMRPVEVSLQVADRTYRNEKWALVPGDNTLVSIKPRGAAILYNAVRNGESVTISRSLREPVSFTPPPIDDMFARFGADCGAGNAVRRAPA